MLAVAEKAKKLDVKGIKSRREALGLTLAQAAQAAGFETRQEWYHIESGRRLDVKISTLNKLASALQCAPEDLLK